MGYITAIKFAMFVFPVIALILTLPYIIVQYFKYGSVSFLRSLILFTFFFYMLCAYFLVIMPLPHRYEVGPGRELNLVPFKFIEKFKAETVLNIHDRSTYVAALRQECVYVVLFNVLLTMPFGMYMKYYFKKKFLVTTFLTFCLSAFFEFTQYTGLYFIYQGSYRICDVDDLIQNTMGGMLGYVLMSILGLMLPVPSRDDIDNKAYAKGLRVSGLRRTVMCGIDTLIFGGICFYVMYKYPKWTAIAIAAAFVLYYVVFPLITNGRTFGCCIARLRISAPDHRNIRMIFRNAFVALYYAVIPLFIGEYLIRGAKELQASRDNKLIVAAVVGLAIFLFYMVNAIIVWSTRRIYYDMWFKTSFVSTIKVKGMTPAPEDASGYIQSADGWLVRPSKKMFTNPLEFEEEVRQAEERMNGKSAERTETEKPSKEEKRTEAEKPSKKEKRTETEKPSKKEKRTETVNPSKTEEAMEAHHETDAHTEQITDPNFDLWADEDKNK